MKILKQSTATTLLLGPFVDATDGSTAETGLTISQADVLLWKEGGTTLAQKNESTACTHRSNGLYTCPIDTTDTNTLGALYCSVHESGALPVRHDFFVVPANVFDALKAGTGVGVRADAQGWLGQTIAAADTNGYPKVTIKSGSGTGEVSLSSGGVSLSASGLGAAADAVWDEATSGHVAAGSYGANLPTIRANTAQAGAATTITLDASASAVDDFYNNQFIFILAGTGAGQGRIISDYNGTTKVATVSTWATNPSSDSVFNIQPFGSVPGASAPTAAENADAVWDEARADHVASGTFGQLYLALAQRINTAQAGGASTITLDASASATDNFYRYSVVTIISGTGAGQSRQISAYTGSSKVATVGLAWTTQPDNTSVFAITPLGVDAATVAQIADGVWDEARAGHTNAGSFGEYTNADVLRLSGDSTAADNAEAFFDGTGYAGTNNVIPNVTSVTGNVAGSVGSVTGAVASVTGAVGSVTGNVGGNVTGSVGSLAAQAKADVNAEVVDVIRTDTVAELSAVPAATSTLSAKINWLFALARNKMTQDSTTQTLRNDADSGDIATSTTADDGSTTTRGEWT